MGESELDTLRPDFDRRLKLEFSSTVPTSNVTSDAGLLPFQELYDALSLTEMAGAVLSDGRRGKSTRHATLWACLNRRATPLPPAISALFASCAWEEVVPADRALDLNMRDVMSKDLAGHDCNFLASTISWFRGGAPRTGDAT